MDGQPEMNFDVSVLAIDRKGTPLVYPTDSQIRRAIEEEKALPRNAPLFFWDDHSEENPHPEVIYQRKFRQLLLSSSITTYVTAREMKKERKYGVLGVYPLVFTTGGAASHYSIALVNQLTLRKEKLADQSFFRRDFLGRISVILLRSSARMAAYSTTSARF